jgi:prenylcysteine oxidase/farnesylcysteine lyase
MYPYMLESEMANLAIVGAGIGGCSAAYFAHKYLPNVNVAIYDTQNRIGGRILTRNANGAKLELGAAFFNIFNRTLLGTLKAEQLKITPVQENMDFAVWNGSEFVFRSNNHSSATIIKLLAKYKLNLTRTFLLLRETRKQIAKLYKEEQKNPGDIGEIFKFAGLDKSHKRSLFDALIERGVNQAFIDEVVTPITRTIYSQNADLGGFAGISSLIGVYSGETYCLAEGNSTLPVHLADASNAKVKLGQKVDRIEKTPCGSYKVYTETERAVFDSVIIATPLEIADIAFDGLSMPNWKPQPYQTVYRRIMRGVFSPNYFGLKNSAEPPAIVLTTQEADPITHFSIQKISDSESLVTISSPDPLKDKVFEGVFKNGGVTVLEHCWKAAYPIFKPLKELPLTRIDKRLIYASAVEPSVSSMETSTLSGLNAVRLLSEENSHKLIRN